MQNEQTALVIGGSGYIGRATVAALSEAGVHVILTYHSGGSRAEAVCQRHRCSAYQLDLNDNESIPRLFEALRQDNLLPQTIVHCAAINRQKPQIEFTVEDWESVMRVNCQSLFKLCQITYLLAEAQRHFVQNIIALSAINQKQGFDLPLPFAASQGAINQLVASASQWLGPIGTRVNAIVPGLLEDGLSIGFSEGLRHDFVKFSALGRLGTSREIARCIRWFALHNTYINGQCIPVNGGI